MTQHDEAAHRLAIVCANAEGISARLRNSRAGSDTIVQDLLTAARRGDDVSDAVDVLHAVLQALGDVQGLYAYGDNGRTADRGVRAVGIDRECSPEPIYLCPTARCTRYWWPQGPAPVPHCAVSDATLRRELR